MSEDLHGMHKLVDTGAVPGVWYTQPLPVRDDSAILPILLAPKRVDKAWGYELWVCNNDEFCGKLLHFNQGAQFSCHSHHKKREVFAVERGKIQLMTIDQRDASQTVWILNPGDVVEIPRFLPHQITAIEESDVREYSTTHRDSDSYRVIAGDSQKPREGWKS